MCRHEAKLPLSTTPAPRLASGTKATSCIADPCGKIRRIAKCLEVAMDSIRCDSQYLAYSQHCSVWYECHCLECLNADN